MSVLLSQVIVGLVSAIGGWLAKVLHNWYTKQKMIKQTQAQADASVLPLKSATTGADIEKATNSALNGF